MHRPRPETVKTRATQLAAITSHINDAIRALFGMKLPMQVFAIEKRKLRRLERRQRRNVYSRKHIADGLNGARAVARRLRQIERGQLREANGLVRD